LKPGISVPVSSRAASGREVGGPALSVDAGSDGSPGEASGPVLGSPGPLEGPVDGSVGALAEGLSIELGEGSPEALGEPASEAEVPEEDVPDGEVSSAVPQAASKGRQSETLTSSRGSDRRARARAGIGVPSWVG
jgi:hypothetical protein